MVATDEQRLAARAEELFTARERLVYERTDALFGKLMVVQWLGGVAAAAILSPRSWSGTASTVHPHVWAALLLGAVLTSLPLALIRWRRGEWYTRQAVAVGQLLMSALLIHVSGGRLETHFHIFGSLAFLAFYRDPKVIWTGAAVVALDHLIRGLFWPLSVYGVATASPWRWTEHAFWVAFECSFLFAAIAQSLRDQRRVARNQAELERKVQELEETQRQLIHADRLGTIGRMSAGIAHEINNPMSYVVGNLEFLLKELVKLGPLVPSETVEEALSSAARDALEGGKQVRRIVKDLKALSHVDEDRCEEVDLQAVLESAMKISAKEVQSRARLVKKLEAVPRIHGDSGRLGQVFLNLIVNAAQACTESPAVNQVTVSCRTDERGAAVVEIRDTGAGIPEELRARLFKPFFTTKPVGVGTGLGLSISQQIVAGLGGKITVESHVNQGTCFTVLLPPGPRPQQRPRPTPAPEPKRAA